MMARQVARQFCRLREVHSLVYGRRASGKNGRKLTVSTRVGSRSRLMNYLGLMPSIFVIVQKHQGKNTDTNKLMQGADLVTDEA
ncbi:hypothetical protein NNRS527_02654 [Nitrosospira sp. NRS527]|nr:hypothetical protein NNRS527_02654 [Nitrosospira sp. NRS527]